MIVEKLIDKLATYPSDMEVRLSHKVYDNLADDIDIVNIIEGYVDEWGQFVLDSDHPKKYKVLMIKS